MFHSEEDSNLQDDEKRFVLSESECTEKTDRKCTVCIGKRKPFIHITYVDGVRFVSVVSECPECGRVIE